MGYITFNGIGEDYYNLKVKDIKRTVLPEIINRQVKSNAGDGSYYFGSTLGNEEITITFQIINATTKQEIQNIITQVASWLLPEDREEKILTIQDEPNIIRYVIVTGSTGIDEVFSYATFSITFLNMKAYKYSDTITTIANANLTPLFITSQLPVITITFTGSETDFAITDSISGNKVSIEGSFVNTDVVVIDNVEKTITKNTTSIITSLDFINTTWIKLLPSGYSLSLDTVNATFVTKIRERFK